jgi:translation initiation factor IF-3
MAPEQTNGYASRRQQTRGGDNQGRLQPQDPRRNGFNENQRPLEQPNQPPPLPRFSQGRSPPQDLRRNERGSHMPPNNNNQRQFRQPHQSAEPAAGRDAGNPASAAARSLGVFSTRKPATPEVKKTDGAAAGKPAATKSFGIFSSPKRGSDGKSS